MALVFKIKFQDSLRRWVVCENLNQTSFTLGIQELEGKVRELFHIASTAPIVITYVDREDDVVTLADDQDLLDACLVQRLNPLRMNVRLREESPDVCSRSSLTPRGPGKDSKAEAFLKACFPHATSEVIERFLSKYPQVVDMTIPAEELMRNVQLWKDLLGKKAPAACDGYQAKVPPSERAGHDLFKHPCANEPASGSRHKSGVGSASSVRVFHRGVQCDGCGMTPIEGPRYRSMKLYDYDLCSSCFEAFGNETDFQRIDVPAHLVSHGHGFTHPSCPARWWQSRQHIEASALRPSFARGPYGWMSGWPVREQRQRHCPSSQAGGKLNASFVKDVTVSDGTEVAPCTKFTKIWQLRNVGAIPWPQRTQLVRIGGALLSSEEVVNLELPEGGLPSGADVHASVDLIAPEEVGEYVSHWRLMSPEGRKFGHRLWVVIHVAHRGVESQLQEQFQREETAAGENEAVALETEETDDVKMFEIVKGGEILLSAPSSNSITSSSKQPLASDCDETEGKFAGDTQKIEDLLTSVNVTNGFNATSDTEKVEDLLASVNSTDDFNVSSDTEKVEDILTLEESHATSDTRKVEDLSTLENATDEFNGTSVVEEGNKDNSAEDSVVPIVEEVLSSQGKEQYDSSSSTIDNEVDGFSVVGKPMENVGWYNIAHQGSQESMQTVLIQEQSTENVVVGSINTEQEIQLQLLESMGFLDLALNADLMEKNNQDLLLTLDDLVEVARWDNMLKDLQEMGFNDKLMNCRLLLENKGSMKQAVKNLVEMEKKKAGWQEVLTI